MVGNPGLDGYGKNMDVRPDFEVDRRGGTTFDVSMV